MVLVEEMKAALCDGKSYHVHGWEDPRKESLLKVM